MRRLTALILAGLLCLPTVPAQASAGVELFLKIPWSLGIHLYQWMNRDNRKVLYVEVTAEGADLEHARQSAYRMAVERAVGVIISSETVVRDQRISRDEIITYASGFVHDFRLVDQIQRGDRTWVKMQVWVSHSTLMNRLLNQSRDSGVIEGGRISEQIDSFRHSRESGDRLLTTVLNDYPGQAFDLRMGNTRVIVDSNRATFLQVPFVMGWNKDYISSLQEAVRTINQRTDCGGWFSVCNNLQSTISVGGVTAYFDDAVSYDLMHKHTLISRPVLELTLFDSSNRAVFRDCWNLPELTQDQYTTRPFVDLGGYRVVISPDRSISSNIFVPLDKLPVRSLDRAEIRPIRQNQCPR
jgi:hypothetical protein